MADYRLSRRAATDLEAIAEFKIDRFGVDQSRRYRDELIGCLAQSAENPALGRRAEQLAPGLRRFEHGDPIVFYTAIESGSFVRVLLHSRMDVARQFLAHLSRNRIRSGVGQRTR